MAAGAIISGAIAGNRALSSLTGVETEVGKILGPVLGKGVDLIAGLFGGGSSKKMSCGQRENQLRATIEQYLTPEDIRNLLTGRYFPWQDRRPDISRPEITPGALAYYVAGGSNCKAERSDEQRFVQEVKRVLEKRMKEAKQQESAGVPPSASDTTTTSKQPSVVGSIPSWVWGLGAALVAAILFLLTQGRP